MGVDDAERASGRGKQSEGDGDHAGADDAVLSTGERSKVDDRPDDEFYGSPRFVQHVDDAFRERLTALYARLLSPGDDVLDLTSSWVSHLPDEAYGRVVGHGLNEAELAANDRLDDFFVRDLNADQSLPLGDGAFDAVLCAVSVQYLQFPGAVFAEVGRVLRPGGVVVVSFSNRLFPTKAVRAWREASMDDRAALVARYLRAAGCFTDGELVRQVDPGRDPFYAVVAGRVDREGDGGGEGEGQAD
jgi:SAM-dependent methyltransferase